MTAGSSLRFFFIEKATTSIFFTSFSVAFGLGSAAGIVPQALLDRCARIDHEYEGTVRSSFERDAMPDE